MLKAKKTALALALMGMSSLVVAGPNTSNGTITFDGVVDGECGFHHNHANDTATLGMSNGDETVWGTEGTIRYVNNTGSDGVLKLSDDSELAGIEEDNIMFRTTGAAVGEKTAAQWKSEGAPLVNQNGNGNKDNLNVSATVLDSTVLEQGTVEVVSVWTVECNAPSIQ